MTITSVKESAVTDAVMLFLEETADLSSDDSGNIGVVLIGDHMAPSPTDSDVLTDIDIVSGELEGYLVLYQVPMGTIDRDNRSGYAGGTPASRLIRYQLTGVSTQRDAAQMLAEMAAVRLCQPDADRVYPLVVPGHHVSRMERIGSGVPDYEGRIFQWVELIEADVSVSV